MTTMRLGFLGAGRMATALARGLLSGGLVEADALTASDPYPAARDAFARETGAVVLDDNSALAKRSNVLVLAVKPQQFAAAGQTIAQEMTKDHLVISIMAGVTMASLRKTLGAEARLVRVMPNTPALVGSGAAGYCLSDNCTKDDGPLVEKLLKCVGIAERVSEPLLDAVTGLSGSGPAFIYAVIEALSDGGVLVGLPRDVAIRLAAQTVKGAAEMVLQTGQHPGVLKDQVTSPGGTTIAGLAALEAGALRSTLMEAVRAATERSQQLGRGE
jgi:pyrroline-5-carboxylate reductase